MNYLKSNQFGLIVNGFFMSKNRKGVATDGTIQEGAATIWEDLNIHRALPEAKRRANLFFNIYGTIDKNPNRYYLVSTTSLTMFTISEGRKDKKLYDYIEIHRRAYYEFLIENISPEWNVEWLRILQVGNNE